MTKTRDIILEALLTHGPLGVSELAEHAGVTSVSVRHHLTALQASGLVQSDEVRQRVGRPRLAYSLTETAVEQRMPQKYARLSGRLLDEMKSALPPGVVGQLLTSIARRRAAGRVEQMQGKPFEEKIGALVDILGEEGFMVEWKRAGQAYELTEHNCPYYWVGQQHPEICTFDLVLISAVLDVPVEKTTCLLNGDDQCIYMIPEPA